MSKEELIEQLSNRGITGPTLKIMTASLKDNEEYKIEEENGNLKVSSNMTPGSNGTYMEMIYGYDEETKEKSLVVTNKEYNPNVELRNGFREEVALNVFTKSRSFVFDEDDLLVYSSSFSDDNKYVGKNDMPLDYSETTLKEYFKETTPIYDKGRIARPPKDSYQPFTNQRERYGKTSVIREFGRSPIHGEYSDIKITFDDNSRDDIKVLEESYGTFYRKGREMKVSDEEEIVRILDESFKESQETGFDEIDFRESLESKLFKTRTY